MARTRDEEATLEPFLFEGMQLLKKSWRKTKKTSLSVPAIVLNHVGQLDDKLALLILLTQLKGLFLYKEGVKQSLWSKVKQSSTQICAVPTTTTIVPKCPSSFKFEAVPGFVHLCYCVAINICSTSQHKQRVECRWCFCLYITGGHTTSEIWIIQLKPKA